MIETKNKRSEHKDGKIYYADGSEETIAYGTVRVRPAFEKNRAEVASVTIPDGSAVIEGYIYSSFASERKSGAFQNCTALESITLPDGVVEIGSYAFSGCSSLIEITLPDGLTCIGDYAFNFCEDLTIVSLPDSLG